MAEKLYFLNRKSESIVEQDRNMDFDVLSYDTVWPHSFVAKFRRGFLPPTSGYKTKVSIGIFWWIVHSNISCLDCSSLPGKISIRFNVQCIL
jgi:hypothetical protein